MNYILNRLTEPSTFAGIAAFFASFNLLGLNEAEWNEFFGAIAVFAGIAAVIIREGVGDSEGADD